jgi:hypothetical protein
MPETPSEPEPSAIGTESIIEGRVTELPLHRAQDVLCQLWRMNGQNREIIDEALERNSSTTRTTQQRTMAICTVCYAQYDTENNEPGSCEPIHPGMSPIK